MELHKCEFSANILAPESIEIQGIEIGMRINMPTFDCPDANESSQSGSKALNSLLVLPYIISQAMFTLSEGDG